ncbi:MAG: TonB-dependent receptor [Flavobacteriales bacterium]|jgi:hemoglobin/transferrin/lactoferrin receptor protein
MHKLIAFLVFIFTLSVLGNSQKVTVMNYTTQQPIENVQITNQDGSVLLYSDTKGEVSLNDFGLKELIYFSHPSFESAIISISQVIENNYEVFLFDEILLPQIDIKPPRENTHEDFSSVRINKISLQDIKLTLPQTSADMLQKNANILVQKSQSGGGSPIIRGFEANKILLVVDGVRMNNAIYRSGHLQNAITVDANILQNTDVFYGPGSVIYGSDALGGVIHFHTKNPEHSMDTTLATSANAMARLGTANGEQTYHVDFNLGSKKLASLSSITFSSFSDFKMGKNRTHGYSDFGKIKEYTNITSNGDFVEINENENSMPRTGYQQLDILQKLSYQIKEGLNLGMNVQYSTSSKINRFDKLNEYRNGALRFSEWHYGPQNRILTSLKLENKNESKFSDYYTIIAAFQKIDEDRISRSFGSSSRFTEMEDVFVYSLNADFLKKLSNNEVLYFGAEVTHNQVNSTANEENIVTGTKTPTQTRYPGVENRITSMAFYTTIDKKITENVIVNLGARYSHFVNYSQLSDSTFTNFPFRTIDFNTGALSGSFSVKYEEKNGVRIELIGSSGFRAPNLDDYGKVFERNGDLVVPNNNLKPEFVYTGELNISKKWIKNEREYLHLKAAGFYTSLTNTLVLNNYQLNGNDSIVYRGDKVNLVSNQNINSALIYGASFDMRFAFTPYLKFIAAINFTQGENVTDNTPLSHIPPVFGRAALNYTSKKIQLQLASQFNGMKKIEDFGADGTDNPEEATLDGSPAWTTLNLYSTYKITNSLSVQIGIENILDTHYKQFASGVSALGRNFTFALRGKF